MSMIVIKKGDRTKVSPNFIMSEFFSKSIGVTEHPFDKNLIDAVQALRTYYATPIIVTSTFRTPAHNLAVGGSSTSMHLQGRAVDFKMQDLIKLEQMKEDLRKFKHNHPAFKNIKIGGIGIYKGFIHLDTGNAGRFWDQEKKNSTGNEIELSEYETVKNPRNMVAVGLTGLAIATGIYFLFIRKKSV